MCVCEREREREMTFIVRFFSTWKRMGFPDSSVGKESTYNAGTLV